jgi:hypothetical protein
MIALRIDDQTYATWREQAAARGLSVEDWLKAETASRLTIESRQAVGVPDDSTPMPDEDWTTRLRAFAERHRPTGCALDDSRESIYD